jgi:ABC-type uncharacterized transport system involved in gliding motility auxiliary subunit
METIKRFLNYISLLFLIVGFALLKIFMGKPFIGWIIIGFAILLFVFYIYLHINDLKNSLRRKTFLYKSNLLLIIVLILAIIIAINILSVKVQKRYDFTEGKIYSLSPQTIKVLKNLKDELNIKAFYPNEIAFKAEDTLKLYKIYSPKIKYEIIDPNKNPGIARRYNITVENTVILEYKDKEEKINNLSEEELTNAIIKITRDKKQTICFLQGHGEVNPGDTGKQGFSFVKDNLKKIGYSIEKLNIAEKGVIPDECKMVIIAGPKTTLFDSEIKMLDDYIGKGNNMFLMIDPDTGDKIEKFVKKYGISLDKDVVVDLVSRVVSGDPLIPIVNHYEFHEITKNFKLAAVFPYARSVTALKPAPKNMFITELAKTSNNAWGETNLKEEIKTGKLTYNPAVDKPGPVSLAAISEITLKQKEGAKDKEVKIVVIGDSDFAKNGIINTSGNENFFMNIINYLSNEKDLISISPKTARSSGITLTPSQMNLIFYIVIIILPLLVLITGIIVWVKRRSL